MQVPNLDETQAHLRELGFTLERIADKTEEASSYRLTNPKGRCWGEFNRLSAFWSFWLGYASEVLSEGRIVEVFVGEFRDATPQRRSEMIDLYEGWLTNKHSEHYERFLATMDAFDPDSLPQGWEAMLKDNLHGPVAGRRAGACIVQMLAQLDPVARQRFEQLPVRMGIPQLQLVD